jgi:hypothetical protein
MAAEQFMKSSSDFSVDVFWCSGLCVLGSDLAGGLLAKPRSCTGHQLMAAGGALV